MEVKHIINLIIKKKVPCIFVSPHLDDAIFSAGSLIAYLLGRTPITIITVFTHPSPKPYTLSAQRNLIKCGYKDAELLFAARRSEDKKICLKFNIQYRHLGFIDALWRKKQNINSLEKIVGNFLPEYIHLYPFYQLNVLSNHIAKGDFTIDSVKQSLSNYIIKNPESLVFCPLSLKTHIDHVIVNQVCSQITKHLIFWLDFPYYQRPSQTINNLAQQNNLYSFVWRKFLLKKKNLLSLYKSQVPLTFPEGKIPIVSEYYYYNPSLLSFL